MVGNEARSNEQWRRKFDHGLGGVARGNRGVWSEGEAGVSRLAESEGMVRNREWGKKLSKRF